MYEKDSNKTCLQTLSMVSIDAFKISHPSAIMVAGPSQSGKSTLVRRILKYHKDTFINLPKNVKVLWCFGMPQSVSIKDSEANLIINYIDGLPTEQQIEEFRPDIVIADDLMREASNDEKVEDFFSKRSHHQNITIILIVQNLFKKGKSMRDISLNSHYIYLMRNPRDKLQILSLGRQLFPHSPKVLTEAYDMACPTPYSYIRIDNSQKTPDHLRIATRLLPDETPPEHRNYRVVPLVFQAK